MIWMVEKTGAWWHEVTTMDGCATIGPQYFSNDGDSARQTHAILSSLAVATESHCMLCLVVAQKMCHPLAFEFSMMVTLIAGMTQCLVMMQSSHPCGCSG